MESGKRSYYVSIIHQLVEKNQRLVTLGRKNYKTIYNYQVEISRLEVMNLQEMERNKQLQEKLEERDKEVEALRTRIDELQIMLVNYTKTDVEFKHVEATATAEEHVDDDTSPPTLQPVCQSTFTDWSSKFDGEENLPPVLEIELSYKEISKMKPSENEENKSPEYPKEIDKLANDVGMDCSASSLVHENASRKRRRRRGNDGTPVVAHKLKKSPSLPKCFLCNVTFTSGKALHEHVRSVHQGGTRVSGEKYGWCWCGTIFSKLKANKSHFHTTNN